MATKVLLKNPNTGQMKNGFYGFSWTYLFFGFWVPLFRGEVMIAFLHLIFSAITFGIWQLIVSFLYNKQYTDRRITEGYRLADSPTNNGLAAARLGIDLCFHLPPQ